MLDENMNNCYNNNSTPGHVDPCGSIGHNIMMNGGPGKKTKRTRLYVLFSY
jgi:hypothetical protein